MGGKGKGNGGGWMQMMQAMFGGKGGGKGGGGWRDGGCREKPEKRVWIGNLQSIPDREQRHAAEKQLKELLQKGGQCKFAQIMGNGQGVATFPSQEEVQVAIQTLAGTTFQGQVLQ